MSLLLNAMKVNVLVSKALFSDFVFDRKEYLVFIIIVLLFFYITSIVASLFNQSSNYELFDLFQISKVCTFLVKY